MKTLLVPIVVCFFLCSSYGATTNLIAVADTTLFEVSPNNNLGGGTLAVGSVASTGQGRRGRGLLRFDVSGVPTNAVVDSAVLTFTVLQGPSFGAVPSSFRVHRFLKPWVEGVGIGNTGAAALAGETTWNSQFHGTALWSPAGSAAGTDYVSSQSGSVDVDGLTAYTVQDSGIAADVQAWVSGTAANHGWIMISSGEGTQRTARRVGSRESGGAASLDIQYTIQTTEPQPRIAAVTETNNLFQLRFTVPSTWCYEVQVRDSLAAGSWSALTNICAPAGDIAAIAADSLARPQRFYRLFISGRTP